MAAFQEWLPPDDLAYFISDVVGLLDLTVITARYEKERRGGPPLNLGICRSCRSTTLFASIVRRLSVFVEHRPPCRNHSCMITGAALWIPQGHCQGGGSCYSALLAYADYSCIYQGRHTDDAFLVWKVSTHQPTTVAGWRAAFVCLT